MGAEIGKTIKATLIAKQEDYGGYITYVFENLNKTTVFDQYVMCVRFPNWNCIFPEIGDVGYVTYREVIGGRDTWYDPYSRTEIPYKYTDIHFLDFIPFKEKKSDIIL